MKTEITVFSTNRCEFDFLELNAVFDAGIFAVSTLRRHYKIWVVAQPQKNNTDKCATYSRTMCPSYSRPGRAVTWDTNKNSWDINKNVRAKFVNNNTASKKNQVSAVTECD